MRLLRAVGFGAGLDWQHVAAEGGMAGAAIPQEAALHSARMRGLGENAKGRGMDPGGCSCVLHRAVDQPQVSLRH